MKKNEYSEINQNFRICWITFTNNFRELLIKLFEKKLKINLKKILKVLD